MNGKILRVVMFAVCGAILSGCIAVGGTDNYTKPTLGRQLMDLKTAKETGAITDQEYDVAKSDLLSRQSVVTR